MCTSQNTVMPSTGTRMITMIAITLAALSMNPFDMRASIGLSFRPGNWTLG